MNSFQRVIKYCAIAFAIFLTVTIISAIASAVFAIVNIIPGTTIRTGNWKKTETIDYSQNFTDVKSLDINHITGKLNIQIGQEFVVEAENVPKSFEAFVDNKGELNISEGNDGIQFLWFNIGSLHRKSTITIYVPENFVAEKVRLDAGAGNVSIDRLHAKDMEISSGAGNMNGSGLTADKISIDGGVGNVTFENVNFTDAKFACGVGNLKVDGILKGDTDVECGVGNVDLDLDGNVNNYNIRVDSGVGAVRLNGKKISGNSYENSNADNTIDIDGGVGNVNISLQEE